jgi:hypothetical protein
MQRLSASVSLRSDEQADFKLHQCVWDLTEAVAVACYVSRSLMRGSEGQESDVRMRRRHRRVACVMSRVSSRLSLSLSRR